MAITQVTTVTVDDVVIGLSDTIYNLIQAGEFTIANLQPYMIVGQMTVGDQYYASLSAAERNYSGSGGDTPAWFPVNNTGSQGGVTVEFQTKASVTLPHVAYGRNFMVYGTLNSGGEPQQIRADNMSSSNLRIVTSINYKKIYYDVEMVAVVYPYDSPAGSATYYQTGSQGCIRTADNDEDTSCYVYSIFGDDSDWYCIKDWMFPADDSANNGWHMSSSQSISGNFDNTYSSLGTGYENFATTKTMFRWINNQIGAVYGSGSWNWNNSGRLVTVNSDIIQVCDYSGASVYAGGCHNIISGLDNALKQLANAGLKFKWNNTIYKPTSEGGIITGYTDDMTEESDWDNIEDVTGNTVPVTPTPVPPTPGGDDDDNTDPIPVAGAPYSSGLARYYVTTAGSLILSHISSAMGAWNLKDSGKDLYKNIISCKLIKSPAPIPVSGSQPFTVYGVTLQYEGSDITLPVINDNPTATFGSYSIPRKFNDFRDYAPYTKVEIYLPYCGWTALPSHVVGKSVSVRYYTDIIAATCKAIVYCGSNVVAEAAGVIGLDIPMVTENAGAKAEAVTMGLLAYGKAGLQTALGVGAAVATKGKAGVKQAVSGLSDVVSAYSQTAMAFNQNYTEINGKNGDGCCIAGISAIVIKITRPKYGANTTAPYVPSNYAHSTGYVSMKSATVGSFTGLLVAANVDTSGISGATEREKQLIKLYLESGVFVKHPN